MPVHPVPKALQQFVDDELLRVPLLFDQLLEGTVSAVRKAMSTMGAVQRSAIADLVQAIPAQRDRLYDYFLRSLTQQVNANLKREPQRATHTAHKPRSLSLVDEHEVALDVELSHTIEAIRDGAEHELRELQTYISALVGDPDVARDHNPFRAENYAKALWDCAQALTLPRSFQTAFVRHAGPVLAQLLRRSYAAAISRLEAQGIEPAAYRTVIIGAGARRGGTVDSTFSPDLQRIRTTMPMPLEQRIDAPPVWDGPVPALPPLDDSTAPGTGTWSGATRDAPSTVDRQSVELVSKLFDAMLAEERVPADVSLLISRLQGPAMRLTLRDASLLDQNTHPLWRFINRLAYEAEAAPDPADPERVQLLKTAQATIDQLTSEPEQGARLYSWAVERLDSYLDSRLARRQAALAGHIDELQHLEHTLCAGRAQPSSMHGTLDIQQLDTVPADLVAGASSPGPAYSEAETWLAGLKTGQWVRMFLQGRWARAQLLWAGEHKEIWLFGDGASDTTWAIRRPALLLMHSQRLMKTLKQRSIIGSAAGRVQDQIAATTIT